MLVYRDVHVSVVLCVRVWVVTVFRDKVMVGFFWLWGAQGDVGLCSAPQSQSQKTDLGARFELYLNQTSDSP